MKSLRASTLLLAPALLLSACVTTSTRTRVWGAPAWGGWERHGRVESIRETVSRSEGNPAGGAAVGALVGGLLGSALGGHTHYDRWGYAHARGSAAGAFVGAVGGAMVGAAASQGTAEERSYELFVRFEDGGLERYVYRGYAPFRVGDAVTDSGGGLVPYGT